MKNYLFRPFQNDNEKEDVFKEYQDNHKHLDNSQVIGFICRLESTYDVIISKLEDEIKELKADEMKYIAEYNSLKAENIELKEGLSNEGVLMLQDDNKRLMNDNKKRLNEIIELQADNKRLMKQVSSNSNSNSSTHTQTISGEIAEYMDMNDKCKGVRLFLLPIEEFSDGVHNRDIDWDDGME